jgi:hypothetical protein
MAIVTAPVPVTCCTCGTVIPPGRPFSQLTSPMNTMRDWTATFTLHADVTECKEAMAQ